MMNRGLSESDCWLRHWKQRLLLVPSHRAGSFAASMRYAGIGVSFMVEAAIVGGLGWWADDAWGTGPWLLLAGVMMGVTLATMSLVKSISSMEREARRDR